MARGSPTRFSRTALLDGALANVLLNVTTGPLLTAYVLFLGGSSVVVGLAAATPLVANVLQLVGSYAIERIGQRKRIVILTGLSSRAVWAVIGAAPLLATAFHLPALTVFFVLLWMYCIGGATYTVGWISWIGDAVPEDHRGEFFALRNAIGTLVWLPFTLGAGLALDAVRAARGPHDPLGFICIFAAAALASAITIALMSRVPDRAHAAREERSFSELVRLPFRDANFRRFLAFTASWGFGIGVSAPFFTAYLLHDLRAPYTAVTVFGIVMGVVAVGASRFWGSLADAHGHRAILALCTAMVGTFPLVWCLTTPSNYLWIGILLHVAGGIFWSGVVLTTTNLALALAPRGDTAPFVSAAAAVGGVCMALGPVAGGFLAEATKDVNVSLGPIVITHYKFIFLVSAVLRFHSSAMLSRVLEARGGDVASLVREIRGMRGFSPRHGVIEFLAFWGGPLTGLVETLGESVQILAFRRPSRPDPAADTGRSSGEHAGRQ